MRTSPPVGARRAADGPGPLCRRSLCCLRLLCLPLRLVYHRSTRQALQRLAGRTSCPQRRHASGSACRGSWLGAQHRPSCVPARVAASPACLPAPRVWQPPGAAADAGEAPARHERGGGGGVDARVPQGASLQTLRITRPCVLTALAYCPGPALPWLHLPHLGRLCCRGERGQGVVAHARLLAGSAARRPVPCWWLFVRQRARSARWPVAAVQHALFWRVALAPSAGLLLPRQELYQ